VIRRRGRRLQTTCQQVLPIPADAADLFYRRPFELAPGTRPLLLRDINAQAAMLMATLDVVVRSLHDLSAVLATASGSRSATWAT
jgi:hypothetical protein